MAEKRRNHKQLSNNILKSYNDLLLELTLRGTRGNHKLQRFNYQHTRDAIEAILTLGISLEVMTDSEAREASSVLCTLSNTSSLNISESAPSDCQIKKRVYCAYEYVNLCIYIRVWVKEIKIFHSWIRTEASAELLTFKLRGQKPLVKFRAKRGIKLRCELKIMCQLIYTWSSIGTSLAPSLTFQCRIFMSLVSLSIGTSLVTLEPFNLAVSCMRSESIPLDISISDDIENSVSSSNRVTVDGISSRLQLEQTWGISNSHTSKCRKGPFLTQTLLFLHLESGLKWMQTLLGRVKLG